MVCHIHHNLLQIGVHFQLLHCKCIEVGDLEGDAFTEQNGGTESGFDGGTRGGEEEVDRKAVAKREPVPC